MNAILRRAVPDDAEACGRICYQAFTSISERHRFPPDFPSPEVATGFIQSMLSGPGYYGVVAEAGGRVVGSNFLDERASVSGLGPITVEPDAQNSGIGRALMLHALERAATQGRPSVRLVQAAFHNRSLCLYTKLGFRVREPLACIQGEAVRMSVDGHTTRAAVVDDVEACADLCEMVHGYDRRAEVMDAIEAGTATVVEHAGRISGYATTVGFAGHAVGESNADLKALIGAAPEYPGPGFLLPTRNGELFRWCLEAGLQVVQPMTYMSVGFYNEPQGAYMPSILL